MPDPVGTDASSMRRAAQLQLQTFSEIELEPQLHLSRSDRRVTYLSKGIIADTGIWRPEYRVIEGILRLHPEFEIHLLTYLELLTERQIVGERPR